MFAKLDKHALLAVFLFVAATLTNVGSVLTHSTPIASAFDHEFAALLILMGAFGVVSAAGQVTGTGAGSKILALVEKYEPAIVALLSSTQPAAPDGVALESIAKDLEKYHAGDSALDLAATAGKLRAIAKGCAK